MCTPVFTIALFVVFPDTAEAALRRRLYDVVKILERFEIVSRHEAVSGGGGGNTLVSAVRLVVVIAMNHESLFVTDGLSGFALFLLYLTLARPYRKAAHTEAPSTSGLCTRAPDRGVASRSRPR